MISFAINVYMKFKQFNINIEMVKKKNTQKITHLNNLNITFFQRVRRVNSCLQEWMDSILFKNI